MEDNSSTIVKTTRRLYCKGRQIWQRFQLFPDIRKHGNPRAYQTDARGFHSLYESRSRTATIVSGDQPISVDLLLSWPEEKHGHL